MNEPNGNPPRSIVDTLRSMASGRALALAADHQEEVVKAVRQLDRKGSVTIKLNYSMDGEMMRVDADVTAKVPQPKAGAGLFFLDGNTLTVDDPSQRELWKDAGLGRIDPDTGEMLDRPGDETAASA